MISLFIDTHQNTNLAIFKDKKLLKYLSSDNPKQSTIIMPLLQEILNDQSIEINDVSEVIVVNGPGSFTGVRLGVTIAKTIAYCNNISIKCIDSLTLKAIFDDFKNNVYALRDTKGAYVGYFNLEKNELTYKNLDEYKDLNCKIDVDYNIGNLYKYEKLFVEKNPHYVNPLYIKKIEAQK